GDRSGLRRRAGQAAPAAGQVHAAFAARAAGRGGAAGRAPALAVPRAAGRAVAGQWRGDRRRRAGMSSDWKRRPEGGGRFALGLILGVARHGGRALGRALLYPITLYFLLVRGPE